MRAGAERVRDSHQTRVPRRRVLVVVLRSTLVATAILVAYFVLPLTSPLALDTFFELSLGLCALGALLTWQVMGILRSPFPALQAVAALMVTVPLFLTLFATTYYMLSYTDPDSFSEPLTRLDSVYYTVTTFATVGFGDVTASSQVARAAVTLQMVGGLVLVGLIARVVVSAVQESRSRRGGRG